MARANRHYIPGYVWHITHRCHKKEFLLKFVRDRKRWMDWLFEARKRFNLSVLNYMVTSNHIHLLVYDINGADVIPKSMQLIAARTGQEYNIRKNRKGAFWEDRYHGTAVEKNSHLDRCLIYIDLNMVRAGVVDHPEKWPFCGYNEIQHPPKRYRILDLDSLVGLMGCKELSDLQATHKRWVQSALNSKDTSRQAQWTESIATGSKSFVEKVKNKLGFKAKGRSVTGDNQQFQLRENAVEFGNSRLQRFDNTFYWDNS
ncbi:MAG: transposase [Desulfobacterales bacterium]|nr:MAG: transposase [Desulfobacterales bacterium]